MGVGAGGGRQTSTIHIVLHHGQAVRGFQQTGQAAQQMTQHTTRAERSLFQLLRQAVSLRSVIPTLVKALISMVGVLIAFNLLITLPQAILAGIASAFIKGVEAAGELQETILDLQVIIAQTNKFSEDLAENYKIAGKVALAVTEELLKRSGEITGSLEDTLEVYRTLAVQGAGRLVKTQKEILDLSIILSNVISAIASKEQRHLQASQETKAFLLGEINSRTFLTRLFFQNEQQLQKFLDHAAEGKTLLEDTIKLMGPFVLAAQDFGRTLSGIQSTMSDIVRNFARISIGPVLMKGLERVAKFMTDINNNTEALDRAAASLAASIEAAFRSLMRVFGLSDISAKDILGFIEDKAPLIAGYIALIAQTLKNLFTIIMVAWPSVKLILEIAWGLIRAIFDSLRILANLLRETLKAFATYSMLDPRLYENLWKAFSKANEQANKVGGSFSGAISRLGQFISETEKKIEKLGTLVDPEAAYKYALALAKSLREGYLEFIKQLHGAEDELNRATTGTVPMDVDKILKPFISFLKVANLELRTFRDSLRLVDNMMLGLSKSSKSLAHTIVENLLPKMREFEGEATKEVLRKLFQLGTKRQQAVLEFGPESEEVAKIDAVIERFKDLGERLELEAQEIRERLVRIFDFTFDDLGKSIKNAIIPDLMSDLLVGLVDKTGIGLDTLKDLFTNAWEFIKENTILVFTAIGNAIGDVFEKAIVDSEGFGQAFKDLFSGILITIGKFAISLGTLAVLIGLFLPDAKTVAIGAALIAAGTGALLLAKAFKGSGGTASKSTSPATAAAGSQTVYVNPYYHGFEKFAASIDTLNNNLERMSSMPSGVVVLDGLNKAGKQAGVLINKQYQQNRSIRVDLAKTLTETP